jgi:vitamin B12/bleomycin/antimicrobial peptide transport system ATP-binding/permease protein
MDRFDRTFWKRWWRLAKPYWVSERQRQALVLLTTLVVLTAATIGIAAILSYAWRDVTNALSARDSVAFRRNILFIVAIFFINIPIDAFYPWFSDRLLILWREWMTHRFIELEFSNRAYYRLGQSGAVDNPDQRVSEDIGAFTGSAIQGAAAYGTSIVNGIVFFVILWTISPLLALICVAYCAAGSWLSIIVGRPLIPTNFNQQRYEADFRFALVRVRDNAESIAMYSGEPHEVDHLFTRFAALFRNYNLLIGWQRRLAYVTKTYDKAISLLPYLVLGGAYFAHRIELGQFVQAGAAFRTVQGSLSIIVVTLQDLTGYAAVVNRLATFHEQCEAAAAPREDRERIETREGPSVAVESMTLRTPDQRQTLVRNLSFEVGHEQGLLIRGASGTGKTSIFRALAGLWDSGRGRIERPEPAEMLFLPQTPYLILGTLRDQLCYPRAPGASEDDLRRALADVNLADLPERVGGFDLERDWSSILSPGEQQRLAFARLLINRPRYAFLDEATAALDRANQQRLYGMLRAMKITFVSISHDPELAGYHEQLLELSGDANWNLGATAGPAPKQ